MFFQKQCVRGILEKKKKNSTELKASVFGQVSSLHEIQALFFIFFPLPTYFSEEL